jgi:hypothetical protein
MTAKNEHTGKLIQSIPGKQYQDNYDAIFRNNPIASPREDEKTCQEDQLESAIKKT